MIRGSVVLPEGWACTTFGSCREFVNEGLGKKFFIPLPYGEQDVEWWRYQIAKKLGVEPETLEVRGEEEYESEEDVAWAGVARQA